ncbi:2-oxo-4-hydroxy-4-carboxy-5-ureidoimidazoline decarboxylase [Nocardioides sp. 1609]|uniref:2-oxo-4-hydroxy-4-carboxy-5-ureidoimidazoline decarboxylase n=1 Tax=Nocardioides sp. 1609 TaxID=2508327 RepID=UPI00106F6AC6|nr:2-oxo-4-hydroxy-4-carboxy-5-ureidoimidazoline decarboxylase [Nocardioides sp. 1609]
MRIEELNRWDDVAAAAAVRPCVDIDSWVDAVVAGRPYADADAAVAVARAQATTWTDAEVEAALADHPRIGERHQGSGTSAGMSRAEQAGVPDDADVRTRLADGNRRYEETFGRIYLVRAAGRSAEELLDLLETRLANDPASELDVTRGQLAEIAVLRLRGLLSSQDDA